MRIGFLGKSAEQSYANRRRAKLAVLTDPRYYAFMSSADSTPIFDAALALPDGLRAALADQLILSLEPPQEFTDEQWCAELRRRIAEVDSGNANTRSLEDAMSELRERSQRRNPS